MFRVGTLDGRGGTDEGEFFSCSWVLWRLSLLESKSPASLIDGVIDSGTSGVPLIPVFEDIVYFFSDTEG